MGLAQDTFSPAVTLAEAKGHLRIDGTEDDADVTRFIAAATQYVEAETRTALVMAEYRLTLDGFPAGRAIQLPRPPLVSVGVVRYRDTAGQDQILASTVYTVDDVTRPARIVLKPGQSWPATDGSANCVRIDYLAGHTTVDKVPALLKSAVLLMVGHLFENREAATDRRIGTVPLAVESIIAMHAFPEAI
jgi:uncharacterized phiE125 gp8 family phage protein